MDDGDRPFRVLYVDGDAEARDRVRTAAADLSAVEATVVADGDDALAGLDDVECVVTGDRLPDRTGLEVVDVVRERDPDLPVFLRPTDGDERLAGRATAAGATGYFPPEMGLDELFTRVREAATTYRRRRRQARKGTLLEAIGTHLPVSVYVKDTEGRHLWITDVPKAPDPEDAIGKTDLELYRDQDEELARNAYEDDLRLVETGEPVVDRQERLSTDEYTVWTLTTKVPWRDEDGDLRGLVGASWDITDLKESMQELRAVERRFERFASFVSHDLRNPLAVARGYLYLTREADRPDPEVLAKIDDAIDRAEEIIDDAVALARGENAGPFVTEVDLGAVVERAWGTVRTGEATLQDDVPAGAVVNADGGQFQQLLENLFRNSVEHGGSNVTVGLFDDGFYVADDGPGIPPERRKGIFEFGESDGGGTGIGLTIVRQVAEAHDWNLAVGESDAGGARFEVRDCLLIGWPERTVSGGDAVRLAESADVGRPTAGWSSRDGQAWELAGAGENVWRDTVELHTAYASVPGDACIVARVSDLESVHEYSKAGVTIRAGTDEEAPFGYVGLTAERGSEVVWRPGTGASVVSRQLEDGATAPYWYRLDRVGDLLTCSVSVDGDDWVTVDQRRVPLGDPVHVGLAVCSHRSERLCTARFDSVEVLVDRD